MRKVRSAKGGYIVTDDSGSEEVMTSLEEVFEDLLLHFEGRGRYFGGDSFGVIEVVRKPTLQHPEEAPA